VPSSAEARELAERFRAAYEARDVDGLMQLFAPDVVENGRQGLDAIAADYRRAFAAMTAVRYRVPDVQVTPENGRATVRGPFVISFQDTAGSAREVRGEVEWQVARRDGRPQIVGLSYRFAEG
jgi:ketosteroid isomerase-like protein